ncbi:ribonuclease Z [Slackia heliotrinireducens]|uniref:Metal-dependent hydrolase, beta-lactamase superfamily I n=1 Tax=Slackia heliotrinireducens (strain ATCC 29202 / DSM 20476 / NCTC 11029 / RHS 1) TaxID=471855 RepID=C7N4F9_SLAHD|nr:MBL fold metallo-hydrolase [Slackia heliotrinireducens]ACV21794.1 metal-dependent hydrolase, beta-lactamase superfamily I [Slackia heliotrinireducens DSM 20476]VEG99485.1 ribonuclease Z [Slackia heliotrinireducens]
MLKLHVLASGSKGNASVVENLATGQAVLIDCGISKKAFMSRCTESGFDPARISTVLITHEHSDHTKGLGVVLRGLRSLDAHPSVYVNRKNLNASRDIPAAIESVDADVAHFEALDSLDIGGMRVVPFATSHDAVASFGFRFEADGDVLGFMTDTGIVTPQAHDCLQGCRILALEGNHDVRMLENGPYPYVLKQRILGERGHLSNDQGASELADLLHNGLEQVVAMHISQNNNDYAMPRTAFSQMLAQECHPARVQVGYQERLTVAE